MLVGRVVEDAKSRAPLGSRDSTAGIHVDFLHLGEVDDDRVVGGAEARDAVTAAADRDRQGIRVREFDRRDDVVRAERAYNHVRPPVDHRVVDPPRVFVLHIPRRDRLAANAIAELRGCRRCHVALP